MSALGSDDKKWCNGLVLLAFLAVVTWRLPCFLGQPLGGVHGVSSCPSQMETSQGDCCGQGVRPSAQGGELAPLALALLPTGMAPELVLPANLLLLFCLDETPAPSPWGHTMTIPLAPRAPPATSLV